MAPPPHRPRASYDPRRDDDPALRDYLRDVDLGSLDLSGIDIDDAPAAEAWQAVKAALLACLVAACIWLPSTAFYHFEPRSAWVYNPLVVATVVLGLNLMPWLLTRARMLVDWARGIPIVRAPRLPAWRLPTLRIPPTVLRAMMLLAVAGGGGFLLFGMPREAEWQGRGYSASWFGGVALAITTGIILGRWLIMQANAARDRSTTPRGAPLPLPPWFKWVTLTLLVAGGVLASMGQTLFGGENENSFAFAGVGFAVGTLGAIWLARRFDELEERVRAEKRRSGGR